MELASLKIKIMIPQQVSVCYGAQLHRPRMYGGCASQDTIHVRYACPEAMFTRFMHLFGVVWRLISHRALASSLLR